MNPKNPPPPGSATGGSTNQRFMIITLCHTVNCSVSDMHILYSWLQNNYCYDTAHKLTPRSFISHATLS